MNKKFFAALASATMALSATGSLAVFADDFDTVNEVNNWVSGGVTTNPDGSVVLNATNFPDDAFREALGDAINVKDGKAIDKDLLDKVNSIEVSDKQVLVNGGTINGGTTTTTTDEIKSIEGIGAFTNLATFKSTNKNLKSIDLTANEKLVTVDVQDAGKLTEFKLPATNSLKNLTLVGTTKRCPLPILDLSGNKGLNNVVINNTDIAMLDLSNNTFLTNVNLNKNKINKINLDGALNVTELLADDNNLYSVTLPAYSNLTKFSARNNKLNSLDVTTQRSLKTLVVPNNNLKALDLTENTNLSRLVCYNNNLGYLDLSKTNVNPTPYPGNSTNPDKGTESVIEPQHAYVNDGADEVDLVANFEGFNKDNAITDAYSNGAEYSTKTGVLTFGEDKDTASYVYNTAPDSKNSHMQMRVFIIKADLMNRLYNPNSGEHFYTKDTKEKDVLVGLGWKDEGIGWVAPTEEYGDEPVYRLYNPNAGDHHYTKDSRERDALVAAGWKAEGIGWYSAADTTAFEPMSSLYAGATGTVSHLDLFREYNPNAKAAGSHNYTLDEAENDFLCSIGWIPEGIAWKALK